MREASESSLSLTGTPQAVPNPAPSPASGASALASTGPRLCLLPRTLASSPSLWAAHLVPGRPSGDSHRAERLATVQLGPTVPAACPGSFLVASRATPGAITPQTSAGPGVPAHRGSTLKSGLLAALGAPRSPRAEPVTSSLRSAAQGVVRGPAACSNRLAEPRLRTCTGVRRGGPQEPWAKPWTKLWAAVGRRGPSCGLSRGPRRAPSRGPPPWAAMGRSGPLWAKPWAEPCTEPWAPWAQHGSSRQVHPRAALRWDRCGIEKVAWPGAPSLRSRGQATLFDYGPPSGIWKMRMALRMPRGTPNLMSRSFWILGCTAARGSCPRGSL